jgi:hypothetical protein
MCGPAGAMFLNDSRQGAQGLVGLTRIRKRGSYVWFEDDYRASCGISRGVLITRSATKIILRKDLVDIGLIGSFSFIQ